MATKLSLERVKKHNLEISKGVSSAGLEDPKDIQKTLEEGFGDLSKEIIDTRKGNCEDSFGNKMKPMDISFSDATMAFYGLNMQGWLKAVGVYTSDYSMNDLGRRFGTDNLSVKNIEELMIDRTNFNNAPNSVKSIPTDFRFIIPEVIAEAVRTGYQHAALHPNWIAGTQNMSQQNLTMPRIERGDGMPSKIAEGGDIGVGSLKFGKKNVSVFKIGTGFVITDELILASTLDMMFLFLGEVGNDMSIGADNLAMSILINGEQTDGSESIPVIGVETINTLKTMDFRRIRTRMARLKRPVTRMILGEDDSNLDLNAALVPREEKLPADYMGVPADNWNVPGNQSIFLNKEQAMVKLAYRGMMTERRRNPRNQTEELFVSDWINFAIVKRDARIALDKDLAFSSTGFPDYMDIDERLNESFGEV